ncbi:MAG: hypothetical protein ACTS7I_02195 [Candidatus Hodgkinia cicadicola]
MPFGISLTDGPSRESHINFAIERLQTPSLHINNNFAKWESERLTTDLRSQPRPAHLRPAN